MAEERAQRRLAAILAADVVGYSRLMQLDEAGTLAALKTSRREILQPAVARHRGRIVKVMGDGVLIEFASAVDAVECGVVLQEAMEAASAGLPEDRRIVLRIGINLGDVMVEGSDLYGTVSTSPPVSKAWPIPVACSYPGPSSTMCVARFGSISMTLAIRCSRT